MKFWSLTGCLLIPVLCIGCSSSNSTAPLTGTVFTSATSWTYSEESYDASGHTLSSRSDTVTIVQTSRLNSMQTITLSDNSILELTNPDAWMLTSFDENLPLCGTLRLADKSGDTEFVLTPGPVQVGDTIITGKFVGTLKATNETVVSSAGVYDCLEFEVGGYASDGLQFYRAAYHLSPTVGLVLKEVYVRTSSVGTFDLSNRKELLKLN